MIFTLYVDKVYFVFWILDFGGKGVLFAKIRGWESRMEIDGHRRRKNRTTKEKKKRKDIKSNEEEKLRSSAQSPWVPFATIIHSIWGIWFNF